VIARERLVRGRKENEYAATIQNSQEPLDFPVRVQRWASALCPVEYGERQLTAEENCSFRNFHQAGHRAATLLNSAASDSLASLQ